MKCVPGRKLWTVLKFLSVQDVCTLPKWCSHSLTINIVTTCHRENFHAYAQPSSFINHYQCSHGIFSGDLVFLLLLLRLSMCIPKVNSNENNVNANWCNLILCIYLKIVQPWRPGWARAIWSDDVNIMRFCANGQVNLREHWLWAAHLEFNTVQRSVGGHWAASQVQLLDQVVQLHCALKYCIANWIAGAMCIALSSSWVAAWA